MDERLKKALPGLRNKAHVLCRTAEDAEDLLQDTLVKVWQGIDKYNASKGAFSTWAYRIMHNMYVDTLRKLPRVGMVSLDTAPSGEDGEEQQGALSYVRESYDGEYDGLDVDIMLGMLSHINNGYLLVMHAEGYKYAELAKMYGMPEGTLKARMHKVRNEMAALLGEVDDNGRRKPLRAEERKTLSGGGHELAQRRSEEAKELILRGEPDSYIIRTLDLSHSTVSRLRKELASLQV